MEEVQINGFDVRARIQQIPTESNEKYFVLVIDLVPGLENEDVFARVPLEKMRQVPVQQPSSGGGWRYWFWGE